MKAVVEPLEGNKVKLSVEVDEQEFERAVDAAFKKIAREVRIPGFRPGKAPRRLLEARVGIEAARQEALRDSLPEYYAQALRDTEVDPIAPPEIDITGGQDDGAIAFDAVVQVRPSVNVAGYQGLRITVPSPQVADSDVDRQIDRLRNGFGELSPVERPAVDGDNITLSIKAWRNDPDAPVYETEDELYEVGAATVVDELDENLRGASVGDILEFTSNPSGTEGDDLSFRVMVKDVKEKILPDVTDEWASEASEFATVDELRADILQRLSLVKRVQGQMALREETLKALVELVEDELPEPLLAQELERRVQDLAQRLDQQGATIPQYMEATGTTQEALFEGLRAEAVQAVKADLALRAVAEAEAFTVDEDEVDAEVERLAERFKQKPAQLRRSLESQDALPTVRSDIKKSKALEWLVEHVEVVDPEGHPVDRSLLGPPEDETENEPSGADAASEGSESEA